MFALRSLLAVAAALAAAGCLPGSGDENADGGLAFTRWTVAFIAETPTIADSRPTLSFDPEGTVAGTDGCNQYSGPFRTDGAQIVVGQLTSTLIGCEPRLSAQAQAFAQALAGASSWRLTETGNLEIRGQGDIVAEPASDEPGATSGSAIVDLAATSWVLEELAGAPVVDTIPTIAFDRDGTVSGSAGCNTFSGSYQQEGASLRFGPLGSTKMGCADPTMLVESTFLAALAGTTDWSVGEDGRLRLGGKNPLIFGPG